MYVIEAFFLSFLQ